MNILAFFLILFVALIHFYIMVLEMFLWTKPMGRRAFGMNAEKAKLTEVMAKNQGLYNGFLGAGLIWSLFHPGVQTGFELSLFFLLCVLIAGIYGALTASRKILFIQAFPALIALIVVLLAKL